jgi:hypothetical protein
MMQLVKIIYPAYFPLYFEVFLLHESGTKMMYFLFPAFNEKKQGLRPVI